MAISARGLAYLSLNTIAACSTVVVNKLVMSTFGFHYAIGLTCLHTIVTAVGMEAVRRSGAFEQKALPRRQVLAIAASFAGYVAASNLSLRFNAVTFYTVSKIAVMPCVMVLEAVMLGKRFSLQTLAAVAVVCLGVGICTMRNLQVDTTITGLCCALASTLLTALYQTWAGSKQHELDASPAQLLHAIMLPAAAMMGVLAIVFEPLLLQQLPGSESTSGFDTLLSFSYDLPSSSAILLSCLLGLAVSLSMFLTIGATSALVYTVMGHAKTVINLAIGVFLFSEQFSNVQIFGVFVAVCGISWFAQLKGNGSASRSGASASNLLAKGSKDPEAAILLTKGLAPMDIVGDLETDTKV